ncbi:MCP four helix bundle domain-containing protein [Fulvivirgaceae bacterium LMO-SS25]
MKNKAFLGLTISIFSAYIILLIGSSILTSKVHRLSNNISTMYHDRLIPSVDIYQIHDLLYQNRFSIENVISAKDDLLEEQLRNSISKNSLSVDSLIMMYSQTMLVEDEKSGIRDLKLNLESQRNWNQLIFTSVHNQNDSIARHIFDGPANTSFSKLIENLNGLEKIQDKVGQELLSDAIYQVRFVKVISQLLLALSILSIMFLIYSLKTFFKTSIFNYRPSAN